MNDSRIVQGENSKADPAVVAKDGYEALMAGDDRVISGFKNKVQVSAANLMPDSAVAHGINEQQKPVEQEQQEHGMELGQEQLVMELVVVLMIIMEISNNMERRKGLWIRLRRSYLVLDHVLDTR
jgi:hypothetical protein